MNRQNPAMHHGPGPSDYQQPVQRQQMYHPRMSAQHSPYGHTVRPTQVPYSPGHASSESGVQHINNQYVNQYSESSSYNNRQSGTNHPLSSYSRNNPSNMRACSAYRPVDDAVNTPQIGSIQQSAPQTVPQANSSYSITNHLVQYMNSDYSALQDSLSNRQQSNMTWVPPQQHNQRQTHNQNQSTFSTFNITHEHFNNQSSGTNGTWYRRPTETQPPPSGNTIQQHQSVKNQVSSSVSPSHQVSWNQPQQVQQIPHLPPYSSNVSIHSQSIQSKSMQQCSTVPSGNTKYQNMSSGKPQCQSMPQQNHQLPSLPQGNSQSQNCLPGNLQNTQHTTSASPELIPIKTEKKLDGYSKQKAHGVTSLSYDSQVKPNHTLPDLTSILDCLEEQTRTSPDAIEHVSPKPTENDGQIFRKPKEKHKRSKSHDNQKVNSPNVQSRVCPSPDSTLLPDLSQQYYLSLHVPSTPPHNLDQPQSPCSDTTIAYGAEQDLDSPIKQANMQSTDIELHVHSIKRSLTDSDDELLNKRICILSLGTECDSTIDLNESLKNNTQDRQHKLCNVSCVKLLYDVRLRCVYRGKKRYYVLKDVLNYHTKYKSGIKCIAIYDQEECTELEAKLLNEKMSQKCLKFPTQIFVCDKLVLFNMETECDRKKNNATEEERSNLTESSLDLLNNLSDGDSTSDMLQWIRNTQKQTESGTSISDNSYCARGHINRLELKGELDNLSSMSQEMIQNTFRSLLEECAHLNEEKKSLREQLNDESEKSKSLEDILQVVSNIL